MKSLLPPPREIEVMISLSGISMCGNYTELQQAMTLTISTFSSVVTANFPSNDFRMVSKISRYLGCIGLGS